MTDAVRAGLAACGVGPGDRLLVAVSGGLDSTALLRLLVALGQPVAVGHVDHGLRADGADDAAFVAALAADLGVAVRSRTVDVGEGNVQAAARRARYAALAAMARELGCTAVATGHTATDQAETVLLALARGAGLRGLAGMARRRELAEGVDLVRPLLQLSRSDLAAHVSREGWAWREDPSNATPAYRRNRLRHNVLPVLRAEHGDDVDLRMAEAAASARAGLGLVAEHLDAVADVEGRLLVARLQGLVPDARGLVLAEAVARLAPEAVRSRALVARLDALLDAAVGARVEGGGLRAWRERDALRLGPADPPAGLAGALDVTPLAAIPTAFPADPFAEVVDADRVGGDLRVRPWREGDRIRPLGLGGSRLVADLLRERGVPRADRAAVPVVEVDGEVAWVVGHRLAAGAAVTESTQRAALWSWRESEGAG